MEIALPILKAYAEYTAQEYRNDAIGLKQMLNKDSWFEAYLVTAYAPKRLVCTSCKATGKRSRKKPYGQCFWVPAAVASGHPPDLHLQTRSRIWGFGVGFRV